MQLKASALTVSTEGPANVVTGASKRLRRRLLPAGLRVRVIAVGLLVVVPAFLLLLQMGLERRYHAGEDAKQRVGRLVREAVVQERNLLRDTVDLLTLLAQLPDVRRPEAGCPEFFGDLFRRYPRYTNIGIVRGDGTLACSAVAVPAPPASLADLPWFQQAVASGRTTVSSYFIDRTSGKPLIIVAQPVPDGAGAMTRIVFVGLDLRWLENMFDAADLPAGGQLVVTDAAGVVVKRVPDLKRFTGTSAPDTALGRAMESAREGIVESAGLDGVLSLFAFGRLGPSSEPGTLRIAVGIPTVVAFAESDRLLRWNVATLLAATVLALATAWWASGQVLRSVRGLVAAAQRLAAGDMRARTGLAHSGTQFGKLAHAFDDMAETLDRRTSQLTEANAELDAFAYSVSHDLRAPLRAIDGFSRILLDEHGDKLSDSGRRHLGLVRQNAQQMGQLIDDLLTLSRLGRQAVRRERVDIDAVVRDVLESLAPEHAERRVEIVTSELPPCEGDAALLRQVFMNLVSNALKFTRGREDGRVEIGCRGIDGASVYFVADNGVGFDMKYADKLFGVFQRLHRAEEYEGTGVGLAIVRRIVERHDGRVWTEAALGQGATFFFCLGGST